ncbi:MAG: bifunctional riboflavin kinase/FAD synthetase [SAR202 cluster bacterium]|nr:bifunctional riboflavin kinase/FAD synthetase [SAR202 cluster bacterium]
MTIIEELKPDSTSKETILTIGVFDGVHLGHRHLISELTSRASATKRRAGVITFQNHPASVINPEFKPNFITSVTERVNLLLDTGVDFVTPISFDHEVSRLTAEKFTRILVEILNMSGLIVGPDFRMGKNRDADVSKLAEIGVSQGFEVRVVDQQKTDEFPIRSTAIRNLLSEGDVQSASGMLGRYYSTVGEVMHGLKRGRDLGFPTCNLIPTVGMAIPKDGIYATFANIGNKKYMAATSIGTRPTFDEGGRTIESYILDFDQDIYGQTIKLEFIKHLRDEKAFGTVDDLILQMNKDVEETRNILNALNSTQSS